MTIFEPAAAPWPARMLALYRIIAGLIFLTTGTMKVFGFPAMAGIPKFELLSQVGIGGLLEVVGGVLITIGLFTRPVSFILAGMMAVAYFQFHAPGSFWPTVNGGVPAVIYCFFFLYLMVSGPGSWSVDGMLARRQRA